MGIKCNEMKTLHYARRVIYAVLPNRIESNRIESNRRREEKRRREELEYLSLYIYIYIRYEGDVYGCS